MVSIAYSIQGFTSFVGSKLPRMAKTQKNLYKFRVSIPHIFRQIHSVWGRVNSVVIATGYGLDGSGIESRWWREFSHTSRRLSLSTL
jgi:hypothetical protein